MIYEVYGGLHAYSGIANDLLWCDTSFNNFDSSFCIVGDGVVVDNCAHIPLHVVWSHPTPGMSTTHQLYRKTLGDATAINSPGRV